MSIFEWALLAQGDNQKPFCFYEQCACKIHFRIGNSQEYSPWAIKSMKIKIFRRVWDLSTMKNFDAGGTACFQA